MALSNLLPSHFVSSKSITTSFNSAAIDTRWLDKLCVQINVATSGNNGQFGVQSSIDGANWADIQVVPVIPVLAGTNTVISIELPDLCVPYVRVIFTAGITATNGTCDIWLAGKEI